MEEPTHPNESRFWDQVTEWLLSPGEPDVEAMTRQELRAYFLESLRRDLERGLRK